MSLFFFTRIFCKCFWYIGILILETPWFLLVTPHLLLYVAHDCYPYINKYFYFRNKKFFKNSFFSCHCTINLTNQIQSNVLSSGHRLVSRDTLQKLERSIWHVVSSSLEEYILGHAYAVCNSLLAQNVHLKHQSS